MPGWDADCGSQIAVDHHLSVCLRGLCVMKECPSPLPLAADNPPQHVSHTRLLAHELERGTRIVLRPHNLEIVCGFRCGVSKKADRAKADDEFLGGVAGAAPTFAVKIDRAEIACAAASTWERPDGSRNSAVSCARYSTSFVSQALGPNRLSARRSTE